jgi:hypothetical protein
MTEVYLLFEEWRLVVWVAFLFGFAPGFTLRFFLLLYPRDWSAANLAELGLEPAPSPGVGRGRTWPVCGPYRISPEMPAPHPLRYGC